MTLTDTTIIKTEFGDFKVGYHEFKSKICVSFSYGDITKGTPIVRFHSACLFGEAFHSLNCDCKQQLSESMRLINQNGTGVIIYSYQEGRGIGLKKKIQTMEIERIEKCDTIEAFRKLGLEKSDYRTYKEEINSLKELNLSKTIKVISGNPIRVKNLEEEGYDVKERLLGQPANISELAQKERLAKEKKMGYKY